jgi:disulfide bond formation protein DsbB
MHIMMFEKRRFNWVVLALLAATVVLWAARFLQEGQLTLPF